MVEFSVNKNMEIFFINDKRRISTCHLTMIVEKLKISDEQGVM